MQIIFLFTAVFIKQHNNNNKTTNNTQKGYKPCKIAYRVSNPTKIELLLNYKTNLKYKKKTIKRKHENTQKKNLIIVQIVKKTKLQIHKYKNRIESKIHLIYIYIYKILSNNFLYLFISKANH